MKRLITFAVGMSLLIGSAHGKTTVEHYYELPGMKQRVIPQRNHSANANTADLLGSAVSNVKRKTTSESDAKLMKVKFTFPTIGLDGEWNIGWGFIYVYNADGFFKQIEIRPYDDEWNLISLSSFETELPAGTYDVLAPFQHLNPNNTFGIDPDVYYIVENAEVVDDTIIQLKPEESTICLEMRTFNPDGEPTTFGQFSYDENWNTTILREGNVEDDYVFKQIFLDGELIYGVRSNGGGFETVPGPHGYFNPQDNINFYINKVSDRYTFRVCHMMPSFPDLEKGIYLTVTEAYGAIEGTYTNSLNYSFEDTNIFNTPASEEYPLSASIDGDIYPYQIVQWADGVESAHSLGWKSPDIWKVWSSGPEVATPGTTYFSYYKSLEDMLAIFEYPDYSYQVCYGIKGSKIFPLAPKGAVICQFPVEALSVDENGKGAPALYPGNLSFLSNLDQTKLEAGQSAPLLISFLRYEYNWDGGGFLNYVSKYYTGRIGETIEADAFLAKETLKVNGKDVLEDTQDIYDWMMLNQDVNGNYEAEITTDNFEIDGIKGGNKAVVTFNRGAEDPCPPTATMLQFRDEADNLTQVFSTPEDGKILLSATDLTVRYGEPNYEGYIPTSYVCSTPMKVTATVAPTGLVTEAYDEIELTEDPELFYTPGFGAFYSGSLKSVSQASPTGWYDLTITVEDAAGNSQAQTISPAFKIESLSNGVSDVMTDKVKVVGNSIITESPAIIYNIDGHQVDGNHLPSGIYFVVLPEFTAKLIIK